MKIQTLFWRSECAGGSSKADNYRNDIQIKCNFITGSDAQGCMVVLVGEGVLSTLMLM